MKRILATLKIAGRALRRNKAMTATLPKSTEELRDGAANAGRTAGYLDLIDRLP